MIVAQIGWGLSGAWPIEEGPRGAEFYGSANFGYTLFTYEHVSAFGVTLSASTPCTFRSVPVSATGSKNVQARW